VAVGSSYWPATIIGPRTWNIREVPALSPDHLEHQCWIEPSPLGQDKGLGRRQIVDRDEVVGDEFHFAAVAKGSDVFLETRNAGEHFFRPLERRLVAATEDDEIFSRGLCAGAADWAVEEDLALFRKHGSAALLHLERQCAALNDDLPSAVARCDAALAGRRLLKGVDTRERSNQDLGLLGDIAWRAG
jgi:hypothetical protein